MILYLILEVCSPHYDLNIVIRDRNRRRGGVAIIFPNCVHYLTCSDLSGGSVESLWVELFPNSKRAILMCYAYRSPSDCHIFLITLWLSVRKVCLLIVKS